MLNELCGTTAFHIWNVDEVPDVDVMRIAAIYEMKAQMAELR